MIRSNARKQREPRLSASCLFATAATALLALWAVVSAPVSHADDPEDALNALMMGGSGMPAPSEFWQNTIITDYIDPATGANYTPVLIPYPASFASTSISTGLSNLQAAMAAQQLNDPGAPYLIEGYSQSAVITIDEEKELLASGQPTPENLTLLLLGSPERPDGGIGERFVGSYAPGLVGFQFDGAEPTDGVATIDVANQYDFFADFPQYPANLVSDLNAVLGLLYEHAGYGDGPLPEPTPSIWTESEPLSGPYASEYVLGSTQVVQQVDGDTTFYFVPTTDLPLLDPLHSLGVPESVLNIFQPALQVIVEAGYDRSIPFGDPTPAELFPTIDPATFTLEFANGVVQGANNGLELFGTQLPDFVQIESDFASAEAWTEANVGVPYDQVINELNNAFDPFTLISGLEGSIGQNIETVFEDTGVQQYLLDPLLALLGTIGGAATS